MFDLRELLSFCVCVCARRSASRQHSQFQPPPNAKCQIQRFSHTICEYLVCCRIYMLYLVVCISWSLWILRIKMMAYVLAAVWQSWRKALNTVHVSILCCDSIEYEIAHEKLHAKIVYEKPSHIRVNVRKENRKKTGKCLSYYVKVQMKRYCPQEKVCTRQIQRQRQDTLNNTRLFWWIRMSERGEGD